MTERPLRQFRTAFCCDPSRAPLAAIAWDGDDHAIAPADGVQEGAMVKVWELLLPHSVSRLEELIGAGTLEHGSVVHAADSAEAALIAIRGWFKRSPGA